MVNYAPALPDLRWDILYPRHTGLWSGVLVDGGYGTYDPSSRGVAKVDPCRDDRLPALKGWLDRGELVAYRPRHRATVRITSTAGNRYVKVVRSRKAHRLERLFTDTLTSAIRVGAPQLPEVVDSHPGGGFLVLTEVAGGSLHEFAPNAGPRRLTAVGRGVARFHSISASSVLRGRDPTGPEVWLDWVERHDPCPDYGFRSDLRSVACGVGPSVLPPSVLIHGDLHDKNVFVDGEQVGFIDLDSVQIGHPAEDLGNLAAHLVLRALQAGDRALSPFDATTDLLRGYRAAGGVVSTASVVAVGARTLLRLACLYRFRRRWRNLTSALLRESQVWQADGRQPGLLHGSAKPFSGNERIA